MVFRWVALVFLLGLTLVGGPDSTPPVWAETLSQSTLDSRVALAFRVKADELQRLIPAPWQVNPAAEGASKEANLTMTFVERLLNQTFDISEALNDQWSLFVVNVNDNGEWQGGFERVLGNE